MSVLVSDILLSSLLFGIAILKGWARRRLFAFAAIAVVCEAEAPLVRREVYGEAWKGEERSLAAA